ncbi:deoxycytidyl transferase [Coemansia biformis]|uniref:DNA repair protein REV1 n=1 Tax=Coemansia biformis TaxID=1286918 RepID=A0A9W8CWU1_9FUNG|nr:deoxycytidyl transferase [Coemansia biformis]
MSERYAAGPSAGPGECTEYTLGPGDASGVGGARRLPSGPGTAASHAPSDAPEGPVVPEFGDFRTYFGERKRKLAEQAQEHADQAPAQTPIFAGVVFHINGYTQPSHYELKRLLVERGGRFLHYLSKTLVTHIIASNLARSKEKELQNYRVVRPEWVVDCVRANKLLPWHTYKVGGAHRPGVPAVPLGIGELYAMRAMDDECQGDLAIPGPAASGTHVPLDTSSSTSVEVHRPHTLRAAAAVDRFGEGLNRSWVRRNLATEKDFITRYYANSRLHHLSTWKAEMKDYVALLRREYHKGPPPIAAGRRVIMHADFDCFFVSASLLSHPQPSGSPVVVCHAQQQPQPDDYDPDTGVPRLAGGSSQIASCNYAARSFGVKNGMFLGQARQLCPVLATIPYCFEEYKRISRDFYKIVAKIADETQAVSVDEALLDVSDVVEREFQGSAEALAQDIRRRVFNETRCTLSIGIGPNILLARLATAKAKPDGVHALDADAFCGADFRVRELPNVGHVTEECLARSGIHTTGDIRAATLSRLKGICGEKTAMVLHNFSHGTDDRVLESDKLRQAFGADIGWGVRFSSQQDADDFVVRLAGEVCRSMADSQRMGSQVTLKVKKRQEGQGKPAKFLGHGICDSLSKSTSLHQMTNDPARIAAACIDLLHRMDIDPLDIRAVGIQVQRLNSLENSTDIGDMFTKAKERSEGGAGARPGAQCELPSASQLDPSVVDELPEDIQEELRTAYKLVGHAANVPAPRASSESPASSTSEVSIRGTSARSGQRKDSTRRVRPRKLAFQGSKPRPECTKPDLLQAFRKVETLDAVMPSQVDEDVWRHLPTGIRRELARDYIKTKPPRHPGLGQAPTGFTAGAQPEMDGVSEQAPAQLPAQPEYDGPTQLGKYQLANIKQLIGEWTRSSEDGPLAEDIVDIGDYVESLVRGRSLVSASSVLTYLMFCVRDKRGAWAAAADSVMRQANQACVDMYDAQLQI